MHRRRSVGRRRRLACRVSISLTTTAGAQTTVTAADTRVVDSPLFQRDVLHTMVERALASPAFPEAKLQTVLQGDRAADAPIPDLTPTEQRAVADACSLLALYRAADTPGKGTDYSLQSQQWRYTHAGCALLLRDLATSERELVHLVRELRPPKARPGVEPRAQSKDTIALNYAVLGTLQWLSATQNNMHSSARYARWRTDLSPRPTSAGAPPDHP